MEDMLNFQRTLNNTIIIDKAITKMLIVVVSLAILGIVLCLIQV